MEMTELMKHTQEPWCVIGVDNSYEIFSESEDYDVAWSIDSEANAERIVACVNACEGITNEALEAGVVACAIDNLSNSLPEGEEQFYFDDVKVWEDV